MRRCCGLVLAAVILASFVLVAPPVSAGTLELTREAIPDTVRAQLVPVAGMSIADMAVASDGTTIYAAMGAGGNTPGQKLYKSLDGGFNWQSIRTLNNTAIDSVNLVAVAPDEPGIIAILGDVSPAAGNAAGYVSTDGGVSFDNLNVPGGTWYDVTISPAANGIRYIGISGAVAGAASFQYLDLGAPVPHWTDAAGWPGGFDPAATSIRTAAFSPSFASDTTVAVVSEEAGAVQGAHFHVANISSKKWDAAAGFIGYPIALTQFPVAGINVASIALDPTYLGSDDSSRLAFIGASITQAVSGNEIGGVWRLTDTDILPLNLFTGIESVAWNGGSLVAGATASNAVYYYEDLVTASPTISKTPVLKRPGGTNNVNVAWAGPNVVAAATGAESAFSISRDDGRSFNDVSLINTTLANMEDVQVAGDASKVYMVTDNGSDLSLWRRTDAWERVLVLPDDTGYRARTAPDDKDTVYLAKSGGSAFYFTKDGGEHKWSRRWTDGNIQDLAIESAGIADVAYVAIRNTSGVAKSSDGGHTWSPPAATGLSGNIWSLASAGTDKLVAGGTDGDAAYSVDGDATWTSVYPPFEEGAGNVQVAASGLENGGFIYVSDDSPSARVRRWRIGGGGSWEDMATPVGAGYGVYGIGLWNGALWVVARDKSPSTHNSQILRSLNPTNEAIGSIDWSIIAANGLDFDNTPEALRLSGGDDNGTIAWLIDTFNAHLYSFDDPLSASAVHPIAPGEGFSNPINSAFNRPEDMMFSWSQPAPSITAYELEVYTDKVASTVLASTTVNSDSNPASVLLGPHQTGPRYVELTPGMTYYWRVRTISPVISPWSAYFSFTVKPAPAVAPGLLTPANGATGVRPLPAFSWSPAAGTSEYRFLVATNPELVSPVIDDVTHTTAYTVTTELEYGQTYYWAVKPLQPVEGEWSTIANFTVTARPEGPTPPLIVQETPPPVTITPANTPSTEITVLPPPPAEKVTPPYIWAIITIGGVLIIAIIILVSRAGKSK